MDVNPVTALRMTLRVHFLPLSVGLLWSLLGAFFFAAGLSSVLGGAAGIPREFLQEGDAYVSGFADTGLSSLGGGRYWQVMVRLVLPDGREVAAQLVSRHRGKEPPGLGARIPVVYDRRDPQKLHAAGSRLSWILLAFPAVFLLGGSALLLPGILRARDRFQLLGRGQTAGGMVRSLTPGFPVKVRGRLPFRLIYTFPTPDGGNIEGAAAIRLNPGEEGIHRPGEPIEIVYLKENPAVSVPLGALMPRVRT